MTSCTPRKGRDRANDPWFGQFVRTQSKRSHRKLFAIRQAKPETNAVKESGERIQGPDMSRRSHHTSRGYTWSGTHLHQARP